MPKPSEPEQNYATDPTANYRPGERTVRKNYYPQLQQRLEELERFRFLLGSGQRHDFPF